MSQDERWMVRYNEVKDFIEFYDNEIEIVDFHSIEIVDFHSKGE